MFDLIKNDKTFVVFDIGFGKIACLSFKIQNKQPKVIGMDYQKSEGLGNFCLNNSDKLSSTIQKVLNNTLGKNCKNKNNIFFSGLSSIIEFSAALKAALYPLSSPSKQIIILSKNWPKIET